MEPTNEELKEKIAANLSSFQRENGWQIVGTVARELGYDPASRDADGEPTYYRSTYGPKYTWESNGVSVYVDDYGNYMTVQWNGQRVASSHSTEPFVIPGEWMTEVRKHYPAAQAMREARQVLQENNERHRLLSMLAISHQ